MPLPNAPSPHLRDLFDFRIVVANTEDELAQVTVSRGGSVVQTAEVAPSDAVEITLPWIDELSSGIGDETPGEGASSWTSLAIAAGAYHVRSDRPVVVYQFNPFHYHDEPVAGGLPRYSYSNDASLLLPVHALGTSYLGASYAPQSMAYVDERLAGGRTSISFPGYVAIVGSGEAPAEVTVHPTAPVAAASDGRFPAVPAGGELRFWIAPGDVVVLASEPTPPCDASRPGHRVVMPSATGLASDEFCLEATHDLTGTRIESSAPVAAFGGHVCAFVPYDTWACDHLETQLPPASTLGRETIVTPLVDLLAESPRRSIVRIAAVAPDTRVDLDPPAGGVSSFVLGDGEVRELEIRAPHRISSSRGVLVTEYLVGQLDHASGTGKRGDPAMLTVPPAEQFRRDYVFITPESYDSIDPFPGNPGGQSFVTLVRAPGAEIVLDGVAIDATWETVGGWEVATIEVDGGTHVLTGPSRFGLLVFGLGTHTSYAYPGGLDLESIFI